MVRLSERGIPGEPAGFLVRLSGFLYVCPVFFTSVRFLLRLSGIGGNRDSCVSGRPGFTKVSYFLHGLP